MPFRTVQLQDIICVVEALTKVSGCRQLHMQKRIMIGLGNGPIDLYHTAVMLSLRRIKSLVFCTASLALNSRLGEACRAETKLYIPLRLDILKF